ncbi:rhomboid family intramembrane serine protease [Streptomyces misionensis]|uniref:rhomboid family intramembrane serine protease n=1 Tax=Streptomyces misionensis TaxID=67331 RepID=UPI0033A20A03
MISEWSTAAGRTFRALRAAPTTYGLIALCCLIFVLSPASGIVPGYGTGYALLDTQRVYFRHWGVVPAELFAAPAARALSPVTALFLHGNWVHLLGNMLFLLVFGVLTEERMGRVEFTLFYVGCGYLALLGYAAANTTSEQSLVGASGAISAVLGAFLFLFPRARVTSLLPFLFFLPLRFPAWVVLPFWVALQWVAAGRSVQGPGVAYLAHLVGFGVGFGYAWVRYGGRRGREGGLGRAVAGDGRARVKTAPAPAPEGENQP